MWIKQFNVHPNPEVCPVQLLAVGKERVDGAGNAVAVVTSTRWCTARPVLHVLSTQTYKVKGFNFGGFGLYLTGFWIRTSGSNQNPEQIGANEIILRLKKFLFIFFFFLKNYRNFNEANKDLQLWWNEKKINESYLIRFLHLLQCLHLQRSPWSLPRVRPPAPPIGSGSWSGSA